MKQVYLIFFFATSLSPCGRAIAATAPNSTDLKPLQGTVFDLPCPSHDQAMEKACMLTCKSLPWASGGGCPKDRCQCTIDSSRWQFSLPDCESNLGLCRYRCTQMFRGLDVGGSCHWGPGLEDTCICDPLPLTPHGPREWTVRKVPGTTWNWTPPGYLGWSSWLYCADSELGGETGCELAVSEQSWCRFPVLRILRFSRLS